MNSATETKYQTNNGTRYATREEAEAAAVAMGFARATVREVQVKIARAQDGTFALRANWDTLCARCGARKGVHMAEKPYDTDDCAGYKAPRKARKS
jgi:hypothetical protein